MGIEKGKENELIFDVHDFLDYIVARECEVCIIR